MIRNWLRNFMIGRYGPDQLGVALLIASIVLSILSQINILWLLMYVSYAMLFWVMFRMLSRNISKRRSENDKFIRIWWPIKQKFKGQKDRFKDRKTHKFFHCPSCKNTLRVPKGKGKVQITCPKCGERFIKKS